MADLETVHDTFDHTGLTGVGAGGGEFTETSSVVMSGGDCAISSATFGALTPSITRTVTTGAVRCLLVFTAMANCSNASQIFYLDVDIDGTRVSGAANGLVGTAAAIATNPQNVSFTFLTDVLSAASHTFTIHGRATANTGAVRADGTNFRAKFTVIETAQTT